MRRFIMIMILFYNILMLITPISLVSLGLVTCQKPRRRHFTMYDTSSLALLSIRGFLDVTLKQMK